MILKVESTSDARHACGSIFLDITCGSISCDYTILFVDAGIISVAFFKFLKVKC